MLALHGTARRWEPKKMPFRLFSIADGSSAAAAGPVAPSGRWPWTGRILDAIERLHALAPG